MVRILLAFRSSFHVKSVPNRALPVYAQHQMNAKLLAVKPHRLSNNWERTTEQRGLIRLSMRARDVHAYLMAVSETN